jgi:hypothetical protein
VVPHDAGRGRTRRRTGRTIWDGVEGRAGGRRVSQLVEYFGITAHAISIEIR